MVSDVLRRLRAHQLSNSPRKPRRVLTAWACLRVRVTHALQTLTESASASSTIRSVGVGAFDLSFDEEHCLKDS